MEDSFLGTDECEDIGSIHYRNGGDRGESWPEGLFTNLLHLDIWEVSVCGNLVICTLLCLNKWCCGHTLTSQCNRKMQGRCKDVFVMDCPYRMNEILLVLIHMIL